MINDSSEKIVFFSFCEWFMFIKKQGVKQVDNLSPTLFNHFINDIHDIFDQSCDPLKLDHTLVSSLSFNHSLKWDGSACQRVYTRG
jgi:hypothetical protein